MNWSDIGGIVAKAAPVLGTVLGGPAGGAIGAVVASALGVEAEPEAVDEAIKADPQAVLKLKELEATHQHELNVAAIQAETARLAEINATMRAEYAANDAYVRRWRPTFGYMVAATWGLQTAAIAVAIIWGAIISPEYAGETIGAVTTLAGALSAQWGVALAVLGINVTSRSSDKALAAGQPRSPGIIAAVANRIAGVKS